MIKVYFIILAWNSEKVITGCLNSILMFKNIIADIFVVDNGSTDKTIDIIDEKKQRATPLHKITVIRLERNYGTTISRNLALKEILKEAQAQDYICILDSDTEVNEAAIKVLIDELECDPKGGMIGPQMHGANGELQLSARDVPTIKEKFLNVISNKNLQKQKEQMQEQSLKNENLTYPVGYLLSACWLMRPSLFTDVGLLDENIFYAPEDAEFCIRVWKNGQRVLYCPKAKILHHWQRLSKKKLVSKHNFEHLKGLVYMFIKHRYCFSAGKIKSLML